MPYCPNCGRKIEKQTIDQIVDTIMGYEEGSKIQILAPVVRGRKGEYTKLIEGFDMIGTFRHRTLEYLFRILNRRSNKRSYNWIGFNEMLKYYKLPYPKIYFSLFD